MRILFLCKSFLHNEFDSVLIVAEVKYFFTVRDPDQLTVERELSIISETVPENVGA